MTKASYKSVLETAWAKFKEGRDPNDGTSGIPTADAEQMRNFLNDRLPEMWRKIWWPELMLVERRTFKATYNEFTTYFRGDQVCYDVSGETTTYHLIVPSAKGIPPTDQTAWAFSARNYDDLDELQPNTNYAVGDQRFLPATGKAYQCIAPTPDGDGIYVMPTDLNGVLYWGELIPLNNIIGYESPGRTVIGDIQGAYQCDPRLERDQQRMDLELYSDYAVVWTCRRHVYLKFRKPVPVFEGLNFTVNEPVTYGTQRYYGTEGDFFIYLPPFTNSGAGTTITTESGAWITGQTGSVFTTASGGLDTVLNGYWKRLEFPWRFARAMASGIYADLLKADGQHDKAVMAENMTEMLLDLEINNVMRQQRQGGQMPVRTSQNRMVA